MSIVEKTFKIISYCDLPEEMTQDAGLEEHRCDSYVPYSLSEYDPQYTECKLDGWLRENYPELIGTNFLINIDY